MPEGGKEGNQMCKERVSLPRVVCYLQDRTRAQVCRSGLRCSLERSRDIGLDDEQESLDDQLLTKAFSGSRMSTNTASLNSGNTGLV